MLEPGLISYLSQKIFLSQVKCLALAIEEFCRIQSLALDGEILGDIFFFCTLLFCLKCLQDTCIIFAKTNNIKAKQDSSISGITPYTELILQSEGLLNKVKIIERTQSYLVYPNILDKRTCSMLKAHQRGSFYNFSHQP